MKTETYNNHGIRFDYPSRWTVSEEAEGETLSVTVASDETCFWTIWLMPGGPEPEELIESAVRAFEEEYDDLDQYRAEGELCEFPSLYCDLEFVSLELINSAFLRAFRTARYSILILSQGTDHELDYSREALDAITDSLECGLDDDVSAA